MIMFHRQFAAYVVNRKETTVEAVLLVLFSSCKIQYLGIKMSMQMTFNFIP